MYLKYCRISKEKGKLFFYIIVTVSNLYNFFTFSSLDTRDVKVRKVACLGNVKLVVLKYQALPVQI